MLIRGEKWACEACVRGHRVSNCQHSDRPLQHINKKGRPVSQCQHCRAMRKSRASHVKCDCGEKTSKCAHLQPTVEGHTETCCCNHGGRCSCTHKKEVQPTLDTVPETDSELEARSKACASRPKAPPRRRRANTIHSDGTFAFDQHGNRKHAIKHHRQLSRSEYHANLTRSINHPCASELILETSMEARAAERLVKSEATSPMLSASSFNPMSAIAPLDLSGIEYPSYIPGGTFDLFGAGFSPDHDGPMFSAGLSAAASVDWSSYDFNQQQMNRDIFAPSNHSQTGAQSFGGFDFAGGSEPPPHLVTTTSTSGNVSDVEDINSTPDGEFHHGYPRQGNMMGTSADLTAIDSYSFFKNNEQNAIPAATMSMVDEDPAFWVPNYQDPIIDESPDGLPLNTGPNFWGV